MSYLFWTMLVVFIFICVFMILLVLIQKGRGGGLSGAFGGAGGNTAFGAKTGDVLTWVTSATFAIFILTAIFLNLLSNYRQDQADKTAAALNAPLTNQPAAPSAPVGGMPLNVPPPAPAPAPTTPAPAPAPTPAAPTRSPETAPPAPTATTTPPAPATPAPAPTTQP